MGYIKIIRGIRYKGFEYKVQSWNDLEVLSTDAKALIANILQDIRSVTPKYLKGWVAQLAESQWKRSSTPDKSKKCEAGKK